ncbi:HIT domain-containing protein [Candidatus Woesearchaeota archaeon]|jgi:histidine triad (HIT) family protein|nr:HIT domain-containing protein [Candidatus Woesearchaeota archaeon]
MQITPEVKAQLEEQKKQCVFCKLISGEMEAKKVFEDNIVIGMLDIYPAKKGHVLYMLKEHYPIMPYIPPDEFKHFFGLVPKVCGAIKEGLVTTGANLFIANGFVAGQKAAHFLANVFPRDNGDGFFNFLFKLRDNTLTEEQIKMLGHNFPLMMNNHFTRNPAEWHKGKGEVPNFLKEIYESSIPIYEDEKVLCILPNKELIGGHIEIYSKLEEKFIEKLSIEDSSHLFFTASFAATALFEGLKAQGTNIILKSGFSDDNKEGKLCVHVLPRSENDGLQGMMWEPKPPKDELDVVLKKIKEEVWKIKYVEEKKVEEKKREPEVIKIKVEKKESSSDEIRKALERIKN